MSLRELHSQLRFNHAVWNVFYRHSLRVMHLSTALGHRLGISDRNLTLAALLHDLGKVGITPEIILKPGSLTALEFQIVQGHCQLGEWLCTEFLKNPTAGTYIRHHHERWDGKGYPDRIGGEEISIHARIISVCDVFDTLAFDERPYRKTHWSTSDAIKELRRCSWTQFDGALVEQFIAMLEEQPELISGGRFRPLSVTSLNCVAD